MDGIYSIKRLNPDQTANMHDATSYFTSSFEPIYLGLFPGSIPEQQNGGQFVSMLAEIRNSYPNMNLQGYLDNALDKGKIIGLYPFDESQIFNASKAAEIQRIINGVREIIMESPREIYIQATVLSLTNNAQNPIEFTTGLYFKIDGYYFMPQEIQNLLVSGNNVVRQVCRTMYNLTATERRNIANLNMFSLFITEPRIDRTIITGIVKAAISTNTLTGIKPEQWVDPKVIKIQQGMGERAAVELILRLKELKLV